MWFGGTLFAESNRLQAVAVANVLKLRGGNMNSRDPLASGGSLKNFFKPKGVRLNGEPNGGIPHKIVTT